MQVGQKILVQNTQNGYQPLLRWLSLIPAVTIVKRQIYEQKTIKQLLSFHKFFVHSPLDHLAARQMPPGPGGLQLKWPKFVT